MDMFPKPPVPPVKSTRCQAITDIIGSIALEQTALAHILNAEGDKISRVVNMPNVTLTQLIDANTSVENMIDAVGRLETVLQGKLNVFRDCICECDPWPMKAEGEEIE